MTEGGALTVTSYVCFELDEDFIRGSTFAMLSFTNQMVSLREMAAELLEGDQKRDTALSKSQFITYKLANLHLEYLWTEAEQTYLLLILPWEEEWSVRSYHP